MVVVAALLDWVRASRAVVTRSLFVFGKTYQVVVLPANRLCDLGRSHQLVQDSGFK